MSSVLGDIINNWGSYGWIDERALELMGFNITYALCTAIKSQVLADFMAEQTEVQCSPASISQEYLTMYFDGSLMLNSARGYGGTHFTKWRPTLLCPSTSLPSHQQWG
jgi:hypothetical protein